ncbi:MAG: hypothetical protein DRJ66_02325 [Thermoprotei archaeon]|nr:MAG: hypothetical protein DRJ66_02325 [Thermoprotei archaeon]RLF20269.1 MAG: hypothetical protein DRZ82_02915 [Thermoprotei archaeon]
MASSAVKKREGEIIDVVEEVKRLIISKIKDQETAELALELFKKFYYEGTRAAKEYVRELIEKIVRGESIASQA